MKTIEIEVCEAHSHIIAGVPLFGGLRVDFEINYKMYGCYVDLEAPLMVLPVGARVEVFRRLQQSIEVVLRENEIKDYVLSWIGRPLAISQ